MNANKLPAFFMMLLLTACGQFRVSVSTLQTPIPTNTIAIPTDTLIAIASPTTHAGPTVTIVTPSPTLLIPTATQVPPATGSTSTTAAEQTVKIVLIALEDNGQSGPLVGCGDSAIPINVTIPPTQGVLRAALERLLSARQQFYGESGYYNALYHRISR